MLDRELPRDTLPKLPQVASFRQGAKSGLPDAQRALQGVTETAGAAFAMVPFVQTPLGSPWALILRQT